MELEGTTLRRTTSYMTIKRGNRSNERVCRLSEEPRKSEVNMRTFWVYISRIWGRTPGRIDPHFCGDRYPWRNHVFQIWWRSVQGFSVDWGSNFAFDFDGHPYNTLTLPCERVVVPWFCAVNVFLFKAVNYTVVVGVVVVVVQTTFGHDAQFSNQHM